MLKVLIVDDEMQICELIKSFLKGMNVEITGEAFSGRVALEMIRENKPDIVISDIRMPGIDGLELVRQVQDMGIKTTFILISGHKEFEYAYSAIKYGVEYYMLKPINKEELQRNIKLICQKASQDDSQKEILSRAEQKYREMLLKDIIYEPKKIMGLSLKELAQEYAFQAEYRNYILCILKIDCKMDLNDSQKNIIMQQLTDIIEEQQSPGQIEFDCLKMRTQISCLIRYESEDLMMQCLEELLTKINKQYYEYYSITFGLSGPSADIRLLCYEEARRCVISRITYGCGRLIPAGKLPEKTMLPVDIPDLSEVEKAVDIIDEEKLIKALQPVREFIMSLERDTFWQFMFAVQTAEKIVPLLNDRLKKEEDKLSIEDIRIKLYNCNTRLKLFSELREILSEGIKKLREGQMTKDNYYVRAAKDYVKEHYMENISLDDIANITFVNAAYFSNLFKKQEGMNFTDYLTEYRISIGKELLKDGKLSIAQVGEQIGYKNAKYFSKVFTKSVGIKPSDYRKLFL